MVDVSDEAALLASDLLEVTLGAFGGALLEQFANALDTPPHRFDRFSGVRMALAVHGDLGDAKVYTYYTFTDGFRGFGFDNDMEEEVALVET